jgi:glucose-6-phosphate-specific signal transduction histidine kinase
MFPECSLIVPSIFNPHLNQAIAEREVAEVELQKDLKKTKHAAKKLLVEKEDLQNELREAEEERGKALMAVELLQVNQSQPLNRNILCAPTNPSPSMRRSAARRSWPSSCCR